MPLPLPRCPQITLQVVAKEAGVELPVSGLAVLGGPVTAGGWRSSTPTPLRQCRSDAHHPSPRRRRAQAIQWRGWGVFDAQRLLAGGDTDPRFQRITVRGRVAGTSASQAQLDELAGE